MSVNKGNARAIADFLTFSNHQVQTVTTTSHTIVTLVCGAAVVWIIWFILAGETPAEIRLPTDKPITATPTHSNAAIGTTGCLAAACHGGNASETLTGKLDTRTWQSAGTTEVAHDPHTRSYSLLTDHPDRPVRVTAKVMMARLGICTPATEDARCLACHTNPALAHSSVTKEDRLVALRSEGVGCEGCHGNAGGWLREHTTWSPARAGNSGRSGMVALSDIGERAVACMGCHVGAPADESRNYPVRDMNHDMIAAGHPRLNFDFAEYHRRLPKHWQEKSQKVHATSATGAKFDQRLWLVGRIAQAEVACKLLADRAERASQKDARTPWPELADYNCAACHHNIPQPWRSEPSRLGTRPAGSLAWQTIWPVTDPTTSLLEFDEVKKLMNVLQGNRPPGFKGVIEPARQAAARLSDFRWEISQQPDDEVARLGRQVFPARVTADEDSDHYGQLLLGLAAMRRSGVLTPVQDAEFKAAFESINTKNWSEVRKALDVLLAALKPQP